MLQLTRRKRENRMGRSKKYIKMLKDKTKEKMKSFRSFQQKLFSLNLVNSHSQNHKYLDAVVKKDTVRQLVAKTTIHREKKTKIKKT